MDNNETAVEKLDLITMYDYDRLITDDGLRVESNNRNTLEYLMDNPKRGMYYGAKYGIPILYFTAKTMYNTTNSDIHSIDKDLIETSIRGGNLDIFIDTCLYVNDYDTLMIKASTFGTFEMVSFCIEQGGVYIFASLIQAIQYHQTDTIDLLFECGIDTLDKVAYLYIADSISIMYRLHHKLNRDVLRIVIQHCNRHLSKMDYITMFLQKPNRSLHGRSSYVDIPDFIQRIRNNKFVLNQVLKNCTIYDKNQSLRFAAYLNEHEAFNCLIDKGANDSIGAIRYTLLSPYNTIVLKRTVLERFNPSIDDYVNAFFFFNDD